MIKTRGELATPCCKIINNQHWNRHMLYRLIRHQYSYSTSAYGLFNVRCSGLIVIAGGNK